MNKRQNLSQNFLSHFQIIKFPCFEIEELKEIAENLFKSFNNNEEGDEKDKQFIQDLISIHKEWTSKEEIKNDIICFTIREIAATIKAYIDESKKNAFKIIKSIYCSRYTNIRKNELLALIGKYQTFTDDYKEYKQSGSKFQMPEEIKQFHKNKVLIEVLESALFSLEKKRNIIIVGKGGSGKSSIGREIAKVYNLKKGKENNNYYHFICTEETKCSDLIGYIAPRKDNYFIKNKIIMEWKEGFLSKAIEKGEIVILDNLQEANSVITERLNSLLDIKYDENKKKATKKTFDIPENPLKNSIVIHDNFRIIGICDFENIIKMSPAFLNRFDIIVLENQLENITKDEFQNLINILLTKEEEIKNENYNSIKKIWPFSSSKEENKSMENEIIKIEKIDYISNKFFDLISKEEKFSIKDISRFCYSLELILKNNEIRNAPIDKLIDFIYELLFSEEVISIKNDDIKNILLIMLKKRIQEKGQLKEQFIFEGNESLENYLLIIFASYLINLHLCIIGQPGVGKTSSAKFMSELLNQKKSLLPLSFFKRKNTYKLYNFHRTTKPSHLYGTINLKNGKIENYNGPLMESISEGRIFIADEMNLSSSSTMKSILPVLDPLLCKKILIPGVDEPIDIKDDFFFISCQNDVDNFGRNYIPEILQRKLRNITFPIQLEKEIKNICKEKRKKIFNDNNNEKFSEKDAESLALFMIKYNNLNDESRLSLLKWTFRDIDKIINRIFHFIQHEKKVPEYYKNFKYYHFIYFYLFSSITSEELEKSFVSANNNAKETLKDKLNSIFNDCFNINSKELEISFFEKPKADLNNNYIMKGEIGLKFEFEENLKKELEKNNYEMSNYYNDLFKLLLISDDEPVLLMGPSSYKTQLSEYYLKQIKKSDFEKILLNQKTSIEDLLGYPQFLSQKNAKQFYFDLLYKIINLENNTSNIPPQNKQEIQKLKKTIENCKGIFKTIGNNLFDNFIKENNNPQIALNPGSILDAILKRKSLIIKDIHKIATEVFERFNDFFGTEQILNLNEDIYGTFFTKDDDNTIDIKQIKELENIEMRIIATCPENCFQSLSESVLSRFTIICVGEHEKKEKIRIIENYAKEYEIKEQYIDKIKNLLDNQFTEVKKIKNFIYIFNYMKKKIINNKNNHQIDNCFNYIIHFIDLKENDLLYDYLFYQEIPLYIEDKCLISNINNLKINLDINIKNDKGQNIVFTPVFNKMLDLIFFGICTGTPLIFEGSSGQGKQTAINYICNLLNYDIENIIITKNVTYKDLYKKSIVQNNDNGEIEIVDIYTKLYEKLNNYSEKKILFVFHNIHLAESDVLSELSQIFNKRGNETYSFIGIINNKENFIERNLYYYNYFYNSIYYIVNFSSYVEKFILCYLKVPKSSIVNYYKKEDENTIGNKLSLSDVIKFKELKDITNLDEEFWKK